VAKSFTVGVDEGVMEAGVQAETKKQTKTSKARKIFIIPDQGAARIWSTYIRQTFSAIDILPDSWI
jgi:hypothetical protein